MSTPFSAPPCSAPDPANINRVTLAGNREPSSSQGEQHDFHFRPPAGVKGVRSIRFTPTKDQGNINGSRDIALGEVQVE